MKTIRWTTHAERKIVFREIDRREVERTIEQPDHIAPLPPPRSIYMRRYFDHELHVDMLLCVVVETTPTEIVIVTVWKTSKFEKYLGGKTP